MTNGGDAAEQVVRLSLEGFEVAAKLSGAAAKNIAVLLVSVLKQEQKTKGKARLTNMIKSGKELKVFSIPNKDLKKFTEQAKRYGVLYCVLRDKNTKGDNVPIDIIARAEDASKIQRIVERFELGKVDKAAIVTESQKAVEKREALEKDKPTKTKNEIITEEAVRKPIQKEGYSQSNPTVAKTDKNPPSRHDSEPVDMQTDKGTVSDRQRKPSVKAKNYRRREEHGSAKWGNARAVNKKYRQSPASENKLMTQNVCIGLNAKKHRRNLNTLVCGGSGAGKTRFYCKPNLKVEDTKINYPVMQSKDNPNFYLKHGFDKAYTDYGCPYVQENCDMELPSDNIIIYGHHMNDGSMFAGLMKFKDKSFWEKHKTVSFDTLTDRQTYEVIAVFKTVVYTDSPDSFKYYQFINAETAEDFTAYVEKCKELSLYDTGVNAEYGDKLLTLSTCEYSRTNGRLVVVAKLINE